MRYHLVAAFCIIILTVYSTGFYDKCFKNGEDQKLFRLRSNWHKLLAQHDVTVDHTMLSGVVKLSNLRCSTICDNVCWTMLRGYVKLTYICWTTNQIYIAIICSQFFIWKVAQLVAHSLHKPEVPGPNSRHSTWQSFSSFQLWWYSACLRFFISFHSLSLFFRTEVD